MVVASAAPDLELSVEVPDEPGLAKDCDNPFGKA